MDDETIYAGVDPIWLKSYLDSKLDISIISPELIDLNSIEEANPVIFKYSFK